MPRHEPGSNNADPPFAETAVGTKARRLTVVTDDLVGIVGRTYAYQRRAGNHEQTAYQAALKVLREVDPDADGLRCSMLILEASERCGQPLYES